MSRPQPGFGAVDPPEAGWPPTRGSAQSGRLEAPLDTLPGVGPTLKRRLAKLGLEQLGDLLDHLVSCRMPVSVIDPLEVIDVDQ